jgi:hypothetical protein
MYLVKVMGFVLTFTHQASNLVQFGPLNVKQGNELLGSQGLK